MAGPYQGSLALGSSVRNTDTMFRRARRNDSYTSAGCIARPSSSPAPVPTPVVMSAFAASANASGSVAANVPVMSKYVRWLTWSLIDQPAAGVGASHSCSCSLSNTTVNAAVSASMSSQIWFIPAFMFPSESLALGDWRPDAANWRRASIDFPRCVAACID